MAIEMQSVINGFLEGSIRTAGREPVINELIVSENGTYTAPSNIDGYNPVIVNVPIPTLDEITITSNGTYTPATELEGYNKINVNVPLPDNGYILNTGSGESVSYNNGVVLNLQNLEVNIKPIQSGSGDPSPTNVRPISGWDAVNLTVADDVENPTLSNVYTIDLDGTRYGGTLDVVSGVLTVDRGMLTLNGSEAYYSIRSSSADDNTVLSVETGQVCKQNENQKSNYGTFNNNAWQRLASRVNTFVLGSEGNLYLQIPSSTASTVEEFKALFASNPLQVCYELTTPITIQLTPTQVKSLLGTNNVWADTGSINNIEYFTK